MPERLAPKAKTKRRERFNYAIETEVDRTVREQNRFLEHCMHNRVELTLFSITGASFNGIVHQFDRETIMFGGSGKNASPRLILKSFIAMIIPREAIELFLEYKGLGTARSKNRKQRFIQAVQAMRFEDQKAPAPAQSRDAAQETCEGETAKPSTEPQKGGSEEGAVVTTKPERRRATKLSAETTTTHPERH